MSGAAGPQGPFGAQPQRAGGVDFRLWAPGARQVDLVLAPARPGEPTRVMATSDDPAKPGFHALSVSDAGHGTRYSWRIDGSQDVPDPASRSNPDGVQGYSEVIDPAAFEWTHSSFQGRPWYEAVIYELHVGAFTPQGTYAAAQARLPLLAELGITAIELMPLASHPGRFGWGYDGVLPFAPQASHGSPHDLKRLIDAAHGLGLMVLLDVVYNHFGPHGNHLPLYAPPFFSATHHTPWGASLNFDGPGSAVVRDFFIANALYWLDEYRFDGLRFDAVHAMVDNSEPDLLQTLSAQVRAQFPDRFIHLVLENDGNDPARLAPPGTLGCFDGQWNGDFHHPLHVLLTGEADGYYAAFSDDPLGQLAHSLTDGFVWQGGPHDSQPESGRHRSGGPQILTTMVNFLQNHDQVGNRALGERLTQLTSEAALRLAVAIQLLNPALPLLFMGEEFGATTPFLYFSDWSGDLRRAVTEGRRREFAHFPQFSHPEWRERIPDPCEVSTFLQSKLDWEQADQLSGQAWQRHYRHLLSLRKRWITPRLPRLRTGDHRAEPWGERALRVAWSFDGSQWLHMAVNLSDRFLTLPAHAVLPPVEQAFLTIGACSADRLGPWAGCRWIEDAGQR